MDNANMAVAEMETVAESLSGMNRIHNVNMGTMEGRWKWMVYIMHNLGQWRYTEPPAIPYSLASTHPEVLRESGTDQEMATWRKWLGKGMETRKKNLNGLYALLRCVGIAMEGIDKAREDKLETVESIYNLFVDYLRDEWQVSEEDALDAQDRRYDFAKRWVAKRMAQNMDAQWWNYTGREAV